MTTYIALLRGINVGGHRVKMERLRGLFEELDLRNVRSFIQSGNIFFETTEEDSEIERGVLADRIEAHLLAALGYAAPLFLCTPSELLEALLPNPFKEVELTLDTRLLVIFSTQPLTTPAQLPLHSVDKSVEIVRATQNHVFVVYRLSNGRPPDVSAFLKRTFGKTVSATTTTRFYDTLLKMLQAVSSSNGTNTLNANE